MDAVADELGMRRWWPNRRSRRVDAAKARRKGVDAPVAKPTMTPHRNPDTRALVQALAATTDGELAEAIAKAGAVRLNP